MVRRSTRARSSKRVAADEADSSSKKRVPTKPSATKRVPADPSSTKRGPADPFSRKRLPAEPRLKLRAALLRQQNALKKKKPKTVEELLARDREYKRRRKERIMADPALYAMIRKKDRDRREELRRIKKIQREANKKERLEAVDDDLFVVIVGDEEDANRRKQVIAVKKEEVVDEDEQIENIIETAQKHGLMILLDAIKQDPDEEYLEADFVGNSEGDYLSEYNEAEYLRDNNMEGYLPADIGEKYVSGNYEKEHSPYNNKKEHFPDDHEEYSPDDNDRKYLPNDSDEDYVPDDNNAEYEKEHFPDNHEEYLSDDNDREYLPDDSDEDYVPDDNDAEDSPDEDSLPDDEDEDYLPDGNEEEDVDEEALTEALEPKKHFESAADKEVLRKKQRTAKEQQSFVKELCGNYPELAEDKELLIETLCEIMAQMKPPEPPQDYFVMDNINFQCVTCGAIKDTTPAMARHWQEKHGPRYLVCFACGVDFRSKNILYKHEKRCNAADAVVVLQARARFVGLRGRSRPFLLPAAAAVLRLKVKSEKVKSEKVKKEKREKEKLRCPQCPAEYASKQALKSHMYRHQGARPYQCPDCTQAYTSQSALRSHRNAKHSGQEFICDHCSRSFCAKNSIIQHLNTHKPERRFSCELCGSRYAQRIALDMHKRRVHYNLPPPCACQLCPKRYPRMNLLKKHMLRAHGMNLITKNMFYKALPHLTDDQLRQAKIVMKSSNQALVQPTYPLQDSLAYQSDTASQPNEDISQEPDLDETTVHSMPGTAKDMPEMEDDTPHIVQEELPSDDEPSPEMVDEEHVATDLSNDLLDYMKRFQEGKLNDNTKMIIIQDGKVTCIDDSNMHLYKEHLNCIQDQSTEEDKEEKVVQLQIDEEEQRTKKKRVRFRNGPM